MLPLYSLALLVGAALLFILQPMVAKMVLPLFGGAPAVWNTCVLFFQAALLAGYAYAHWAPHRLGSRPHTIIHLILLLAAVVLLPISIASTWAPPESAPPALWLLWLLLVAVGLPFFLLSSTAPLVQRWFALSSHAAARDPYFLYTASNLGSMVALLGYPIVVEPLLTLNQQSWLWLYGYLLLIALLLACAMFLWLAPPKKALSATLSGVAGAESATPQSSPPSPLVGEGRGGGTQHPHPNPPPSRGRGPERRGFADSAPAKSGGTLKPSTNPGPAPPLTWTRRGHWLVLSFVPSSLMLSVTTYLTTDIAAFPLFWVVPLALYLLTFILAFASKPLVPQWLVQRVMPLAVLALTLVLLSEATEPIWLVMPLHLFGLFMVALACHGELARTRPEVAHLTEFYLWLSVGGVLGGIFNALLAPVLFTGVAEYPLVLVLACLLRGPVRPGDVEKSKTKNQKPKTDTAASAWVKTFLRLDLLPAALLGVLALALVFATRAYLRPHDPESFKLVMGISFGVPAIICYTLVDRPFRFGLAIGALFCAGLFTEGIHGQRVFAERSFFGIHRITQDASGEFVRLIHGNTIHGQQNKEDRDDPLTYYHHQSPIGRTFATLAKNKAPLKEIGVVGLGVGTLAAYAKPGQNWTYYEIDPVVVKIACQLDLFTYWKDAVNRGANMSVDLGDARLKLQQAGDKKFDLLIVDAFNSDAVPVHLLTREALQVYLDRLAPNGVIAFHISNRYLNLEPVLAELAADTDLRCLSWFGGASKKEGEQGKFASHWVVMGRAGAPMNELKAASPWDELHGGDSRYLWTDQFSNIFSVIRWGS